MPAESEWSGDQNAEQLVWYAISWTETMNSLKYTNSKHSSVWSKPFYLSLRAAWQWKVCIFNWVTGTGTIGAVRLPARPLQKSQRVSWLKDSIQLRRVKINSSSSSSTQFPHFNFHLISHYYPTSSFALGNSLVLCILAVCQSMFCPCHCHNVCGCSISIKCSFRVFPVCLWKELGARKQYTFKLWGT